MKRRAKAFAVHLGISLVVFSSLLYLLMTRWYPQPYFWTDGGWVGLRIVMGVDVVVGPLLTAVVFSAGKMRRELVRDLSLIGALQILALAWGVWTVYAERTLLVAFVDGTFYTLNSEQVLEAGPGAARIVAESKTRPAYSIIRLPSGRNEAQELRKAAIRTQRPLFLLGDRMEPLTPGNFAVVADGSANLGRWERERRGRESAAARARRAFPEGEREYVFVPATGRYGSLLFVFRRATGELVKSLEGSP